MKLWTPFLKNKSSRFSYNFILSHLLEMGVLGGNFKLYNVNTHQVYSFLKFSIKEQDHWNLDLSIFLNPIQNGRFSLKL